MNFTASYNYLVEGAEWRGVRTKTASYVQWLSGAKELYDIENDPLQMHNLAGQDEAMSLQSRMESWLVRAMERRNDSLVKCSSYEDWFDDQRRVVRNASGALASPETEPDWSFLT